MRDTYGWRCPRHRGRALAGGDWLLELKVWAFFAMQVLIGGTQ
jgi:hypothetical protein